MLRSIRLRLRPPQALQFQHNFRHASHLGVQTKIYEEGLDDDFVFDESERAPFGMEYGAGPSRLPYDASKPIVRPLPAAARPVSKDLARARTVTGYDKDPAVIVDLIAANDPCLLTLRDGPADKLVRQLVRDGHAFVAASLMLHIVKTLDASGSRRRFRLDTVRAVFRYATIHQGASDTTPPIKTKIQHNTIRQTPQGHEDLEVLVPLLHALRDARIARPDAIYTYVIQRLVAEGMYDLAAKIFVETVEEWAVEGRIGEGADPDSFYDGGGPPREGREIWEKRSPAYQVWWQDIRTWVMPGEVLSPHDRLDLWHSRKLRLPERLRRFPVPIPTSPPTTAPFPTAANLLHILDNLDLDDHDKGEPTRPSFVVSMQALAILSSCLLSKTMPWLAAEHLIYKLLTVPTTPDVYPDNLPTKVQEGDKWAYTAYTHCRLALRSVMSRPPQPRELVEFMQAFDAAKQDGRMPLPKLPSAYRYVTGPPSFGLVVALVDYGLKKLRSLESIKSLLHYARAVFNKDTSPILLNTLYRGLSALKENGLAQRVENALFKGTKLAAEEPMASNIQHTNAASAADAVAIADLPIPHTDVEADRSVQSIIILIRHLSETRQVDRMKQVIYDVIPYLQFSKDMTPEDSQRLTAHFPEIAGFSGRARSERLVASLYQAILAGLARFSEPSLAQRIFRLALQEENSRNRDADIFHQSAQQPAPALLTIFSFTSMLRIWTKEHRAALAAHDPANPQRPYGYQPLEEAKNMARPDAAMYMLQYTYRLARHRWRASAWDDVEERIRLEWADESAPDPLFFNTMIRACSVRWGLRDDQDWKANLGGRMPPLGSDSRRELQLFIRDIDDWGHDVPIALDIRLGTRRPLTAVQLDRLDSKTAVLLASVVIPERSRRPVERRDALPLMLPVVEASPEGQ